MNKATLMRTKCAKLFTLSIKCQDCGELTHYSSGCISEISVIAAEHGPLCNDCRVDYLIKNNKMPPKYHEIYCGFAGRHLTNDSYFFWERENGK